MDLWKWLAVAAAAVVSLLVFVGWVQRPGSTPTPENGNTVESGTFAVEQAGTSLGKEDFFLSIADQQMDLHSTVTLAVGGQSTRFTQRLRLSKDLKPIRYFRDAAAAQSTNTVLMEVETDAVRLNVFVGGQAQERRFSPEEPYVVLDQDVYSHYLLLFRMIQAQERQGTALTGMAIVPQSLTTHTIKAGPVTNSSLRSGAQTLVVDKRTVMVGNAQVFLYSRQDTLIAVSLPGRGMFAYRGDLFSAGLKEL